MHHQMLRIHHTLDVDHQSRNGAGTLTVPGHGPELVVAAGALGLGLELGLELGSVPALELELGHVLELVRVLGLGLVLEPGREQLAVVPGLEPGLELPHELEPNEQSQMGTAHPKLQCPTTEHGDPRTDDCPVGSESEGPTLIQVQGDPWVEEEPVPGQLSADRSNLG